MLSSTSAKKNLNGIISRPPYVLIKFKAITASIITTAITFLMSKKRL